MATIQIFPPGGSEIVHDLAEETTTVGRLPGSILQIDDASVSSNHAEIHFEDNHFFIRDSGSTNGTFVNGVKTETAMLNHGDELRFGSVVGLFTSKAGAATATGMTGSPQAPATGSSRPASFTTTSPLRKAPPDLKPDYRITAAALVVGLAAAGFAIFRILTT
jgi:predicted component of type VI protein secretion system